MNNKTKITHWKSLENLAQPLRLSGTGQPAQTFIPLISMCGITLNTHYQHLSQDILETLIALAQASCLKEKIQGLMQGDKLNVSENRPALHTALRAPLGSSIHVDGKNIVLDVQEARAQIQTISESIRNHTWLGYSGKPIQSLVNIGIGGSDLGPRFCLHALNEYAASDLAYYFISDADPRPLNQLFNTLNPETTLFIVASKSFTTPETLLNAKKAMRWMGDVDRAPHFIAVTAHPDKARALGIQTILPLWDWVGGRYSFCSAINLMTAIAIGYAGFEAILKGAHEMDLHCLQADFSCNLPVLLALIGIWNNNFLMIHQLLLLTYTDHLTHFVPYIQQLDMESNGKSINHALETVNFSTGPLVWGGSGNQAQHSYFQLLCQGTHRIAADFITLEAYQHEMVNTMCEAHAQVLSEGVHQTDTPFDFIAGHIPLNLIQLKTISPYTIGALVALYEHKIFAQSVIWDINPFDQPGVECAKRQMKIKEPLPSL